MPTSTSQKSSSNASQLPFRSHALLLGIDPGLAATGWGTLDREGKVAACGTIRTSPGPAGVRLLHIVCELRAVLAAHPIQEAALEELFVGRNATSAIGGAQARGANRATLAGAELPRYESTPAPARARLP